MELSSLIGIALFTLLAVGGIVAIGVISHHRVADGEILVISGVDHDGEDGRVGYRVLLEGSTFSIPIVETVERMSTSPLAVLATTQAYSKDGVALIADAKARVRISREYVHRAIERLLGHPTSAIIDAVEVTIEENLRANLATFSLDEVDANYAAVIRPDLSNDLAILGIDLEEFETTATGETRESDNPSEINRPNEEV